VAPREHGLYDVVSVFLDKLEHAVDLREGLQPVSLEGSIHSREDARELSCGSSTVDLVVTSPPYLGVIDYSLANRLSYLWFGWDLQEDRAREIGARSRRRRVNAVDEYLGEMRGAVREIARVLRPGGFCAVVVGASRKFPGVAEEVVKMVDEALEIVWGPTARSPSRRRIAERKGTSFRELVCVYRKG
jgi:DNA modification methylase